MPNRFRVKEIRLLNVNFSYGILVDDSGKNKEELLLENGANEEEIHDDVEVVLNCGSEYVKKKKILKTVLRVIVKDESREFSLDASFGGKFQLEKAPDDKLLNMLRSVNCPAIVFPYLREFVSDITKRAGLDPLYLPPVNFVKAHKDSQKE